MQRSALNKLTTDQQQAQQAQIKKLNDQIQDDATAALQAKADYAGAWIHRTNKNLLLGEIARRFGYG